MATPLKKGLVYLTVSSIIFVVAGYVVNLWLGRYLGPVNYGIYGVVISLMTMVNLVQSAGLPQAVSKYIAEDERDAEGILAKGLTLQIVATIFITFIYFLLSPVIADLLHDRSLIPYIQLSAFILPAYGIFNLYVGYYNGLHRFGRQALLSIAYSIAKIIAVVGLSSVLFLTGAFAGFIIAPAIALATGFRIPKRFDTGFPAKKLILFSLPLIGFAIFSTLQQSVDLYLIKALVVSPKDPGFYTASQNIARISFFGLSAFSIVLFPSISRSVGQKDTHKTKELINQSLRYVLMILLPITFMISATSGSIIKLLYSQAYLPAQESLSILVVGFAFLTVFGVLSNILNGAGSPRLSMAIALLSTGLSALLCLILIPSMGIAGAAVATTVGGFLSVVIAAVMVYRKFHRLVSPVSILRISFASVLLYASARYFQPASVMLPVSYLLLLVFYVLILTLMREITQKDWDTLKRLLPS